MMPYLWAYSLAFVISTFTAYLLHAKWVFYADMSAKKMGGYILLYAGQYALNLGLLYACVEWLKLSEIIAPWVVIAVLIPLTYLVSRVIHIGKSAT